MPRPSRGGGCALPGLVLLVLVIGFPLVYAGLLVVSSFTLLHPRLLPFTGLENIVAVGSDPLFWHSTWITIQYSVVTVAGEFLLGLGVALPSTASAT